MTPTVRYEAASHTYYDPAGKQLPGVTRVLSDMGYSKGAQFFTEKSRQRGQAVHLACQLVDQHAPDARILGEALEVIDLDERLHQHLSGYLWFKREKRFTPEKNEVVVWSPSMRSAGQYDKWGHYDDGRRVMVDMKTWISQGAKPKRSAELQMGGYAMMAKESDGTETDLRIVLKLPGDGTYRAYECRNPRDEMTFRCACMLWWDRAENGLIEGIAGPSEVDLAA